MSIQNVKIRRAFEVESDSVPGVTYDVVEWDNDAITCTCPSFLRGKQQRGKDIFHRECKHTIRIQEELQTLTRAGKRQAVDLIHPKPTSARQAAIKKALNMKVKERTDIDPKIEALITGMLERA